MPALTVVMAQIDLLVGDIPGNVERVVRTAERARDELGARLVVFPELTLTGYPPEDLLLRPEFVAAAEGALAAVRERISGVDLVVGHPQRDRQGLYNAASWLSDGEVRGQYRKHLLPNYAVFDEKRYFLSGDRPCVVDIDGVAFGLTICEDIWQPEPAARAKSVGAELLINLNASPYRLDKMDEREGVIRQRVRETGLPVVYVNLVGGQDELVFDGGSLVMGADGVLLRGAGLFREELVPVDIHRVGESVVIEPGEVVPTPSTEEAVYRAIVMGVRDYVRKNGFPGVVLGLSGGIDSALTMAIAVDALGAENVLAVMMPSRYTADMSNRDALAQCELLGVAHHTLPIEPAFRSFLDMLAPVFAGAPVDVTEENIQARCRGILLMAISNKSGRMVLSTSNKSETAVGYSTLYGDMAGGFAPIKDVPKTLVYRLAGHRNLQSQAIPQRVIDRPPSAELRPDQTDQDSLPPYEILDPVLHRFVELDRSTEQIVAEGYDRAIVERIARLVTVNEYKRRQAAPGVRITPRAFGRDRRYPITSGFRGPSR
jgi:NAD+ synthase (glutamine-hydrolysing)